MFSIEYFVDSSGRVVFDEWLDQLTDKRAVARIVARVERLKRGGLGDCKPVRSGVWELRVDFGPGYRVYYALNGKTVVLLLCAGDKRTQAKDIARAVSYWREFQARES
ncbi:MAG: type II toxin-antitoxin system RelE/ParE family toxin [Planctomycetaceae bacterium]|nr:type II toxin-antitoxin system RelE/ParE family toxin [Planctomycetaceae bacterium]